MSYMITVGDHAGVYLEKYAPDFAEAKRIHDSLVLAYPSKRVFVSNLDRTEADSDGLTPEERDEL